MEEAQRVKADMIPYTPEYAKTVYSWIECEETYANLCRGQGFPPPDNLIETWQRQEVTSYLLSSNSKPVAYAELWNRPLELAMEIAHLLVKPYQRGQGYGAKMLDLLFRRAAAKAKVAKVIVHLFSEDEIALGTCLKAGFEIQGTTTYTQGLRLVRAVMRDIEH